MPMKEMKARPAEVTMAQKDLPKYRSASVWIGLCCGGDWGVVGWVLWASLVKGWGLGL